jgi:signal transduction histidine kinase/HPt (histidine-containing phosphotransfer) domain-containing protein
MPAFADRIRILVIEDDELDRMIIKKALKGTNMNIEVAFAEDNLSGMKAVNENSVDCIFIDYNLPGGNGLDLMKQIRAAGNMVPVVVITSQGDDRIAAEIIKNGAADYIPKSLLTTEGTAQILRQVFRLQETNEEKQKFENAFINTQKTLQTVAANAPVILFSIDKSGNLTMFEGRGISAFMPDKTKFIGQEIVNVEHQLPLTKKSFDDCMTGDDVKEVVERNECFYEIFYSPLRDQNNEIAGVMGVATDITGFKKTEEQLTLEKRIAEETVRVKQEFLAHMSHEIRTPMNGIIGLAEILYKTKTTVEQRKHIQSIISCSENLLLIINDILDLSKIEAGRMAFEKMPFSLKEAIANCLSIFAQGAAEKNIKLTSLISKGVPEFMTGDSLRLSQVLNNLLGNAVKFTDSGEVNLSVKCINENAEYLTLSFAVKDTGIGIPKEKQKLIFESFTQAGSDTTRRFGGTGLGLAIVKKILALQDGNIDVESEEGKGSEFRFTLMFSKASDEEIRTLKKTSAQVLSADLSNMNILAAEDNEMSRIILQNHFTHWKAKFQFASTGAEAVNLAKQNSFDIIIMDIQMPEMDGYSATRIIRGLPAEKALVPVIAVTSHATDTERIKCMECGMNDYLSKPYRAEELLYKITGNCSNKNISLSVHNKREKIMEFSMEEKNDIIDLNYLKRVAENEEEFIRDMIGIFFKRTPEAIIAIRKGLAENNSELVWQTAHRIKPTFSYMGMTTTSALAAKLEKLYKTSPDKTHAEELLASIEHNFLFAHSIIEKEFLVTK